MQNDLEKEEEEEKTKSVCLPVVAAPSGLTDRKSFSALAYLAALTIFIDLVIFWMFFTDFKRVRTSINNNNNTQFL